MDQQKPLRIRAYIDGFNFYHAVDDLVGHANKKHRIPHNKVNLWSLIEDRKRDNEEIVGVHYFSAYAYWKPDKIIASHKRYVKALEQTGVTCTMSQFKEKQQRCKSCGNTWTAHEEKETDVRLSLQILEDAYDDKYDRAYIISADTDIVPSVQAAKRRYPDKDIFILAPPGRHKFARDLVKSAGKSAALHGIHIRRNLFDWQ